MSRRPGLPKTGGRQKGTSNKKTQDLEDQLKNLGIDVLSQIGTLLPQLHPEKQIDTLMSLMAFLYPKRKAVEQKIEVQSNEVQISELSAEELNLEAARLHEFSAETTYEPEIAEAHQTLAKYYRSLGPTPAPPV